MVSPRLGRTPDAMNFQATYQAEVLQSRRTRSQRAHFWAKVIGIVLMITIGATLRSEPQLRQAIMNAGMDGVMAVTGQEMPAAQGQSTYPADMAAMQGLLAEASRMQETTTPQNHPTDAVKVNRHGLGEASTLRFHAATPQAGSVSPALEVQTISAELSHLLNGMKAGH